MTEYNYDEIRPYRDDEVHAAFERVCQEPDMKAVMAYLFKEKGEAVLNHFLDIKSVYELQSTIIGPFFMDIARKHADGIDITGLENVKNEKKYLYTSNHRDIVLDAALLNTLMLSNGLDTAEDAIGDNLCAKPWITDMMKLNKSFIVKRSGTKREIFDASLRLSTYIRERITSGESSIWIAEREGRAKDSNDQAQESVLKMFSMSSGKNMKQGFMELNIVPVSISYEFDGCDYLKAKEFQQKRDDENYQKTKADDILNMQTGILGYKGRIHYEVTSCINNELDQMLNDTDDRASAIKAVLSLINKHIHKNYRIYPINYVALDERNGNSANADKYTTADKEKFDNYIAGQIEKIDLKNKDIPFLRCKMLEMYSNTLINYLAAHSMN